MTQAQATKNLEFPNSSEPQRVCLKIHANVYQNVGIIAHFENRGKKDVIEEAIIYYLRAKGIPDPTQPPTISWTPKPPKATKV